MRQYLRHELAAGVQHGAAGHLGLEDDGEGQVERERGFLARLEALQQGVAVGEDQLAILLFVALADEDVARRLGVLLKHLDEGSDVVSRQSLVYGQKRLPLLLPHRLDDLHPVVRCHGRGVHSRGRCFFSTALPGLPRGPLLRVVGEEQVGQLGALSLEQVPLQALPLLTFEGCRALLEELDVRDDRVALVLQLRVRLAPVVEAGGHGGAVQLEQGLAILLGEGRVEAGG